MRLLQCFCIPRFCDSPAALGFLGVVLGLVAYFLLMLLFTVLFLSEDGVH